MIPDAKKYRGLIDRPKSVVYFMCKEGIPVYIGKTRDLTDRLYSHPIKPPLYDEIYYIPFRCRGLWTLLHKKQDYIKTYDPIYNITGLSTFRAKMKARKEPAVIDNLGLGI